MVDCVLRRWLRDAGIHSRRPEPIDVPKALSGTAPHPAPSGFVSAHLPAPVEAPAPPDGVHTEVRRGAVHVVATWPATQVNECDGWLRDLLR